MLPVAVKHPLSLYCKLATILASLFFSVACAHFIEHIEGIVHGSIYAGNGEHTGECSLLHRFSGLLLRLGREVEQDGGGSGTGVVATDGDGARGRRA